MDTLKYEHELTIQPEFLDIDKEEILDEQQHILQNFNIEILVDPWLHNKPSIADMCEWCSVLHNDWATTELYATEWGLVGFYFKDETDAMAFKLAW